MNKSIKFFLISLSLSNTAVVFAETLQSDCTTAILMESFLETAVKECSLEWVDHTAWTDTLYQCSNLLTDKGKAEAVMSGQVRFYDKKKEQGQSQLCSSIVADFAEIKVKE
jgi:hypothetical protein